MVLPTLVGLGTATLGRRAAPVLMCLAVLSTAACGDDGGPTTPSVKPVATIVLTADSARIPMGLTIQYRAEARDSSGAVLTGRTFNWGTSDAAIATVDQNGLVTGKEIGTAEIRVSIDGKFAAKAVEVDENILDHPIAFTSARNGNFEIYVIRADGSGLENLTKSSSVDSDPAWSPDRKQIVFVSNRTGNKDLYVVNVDGTGLRALTSTPEDEQWPAWSPDGKTIVFSAPDVSNGGSPALWTVDSTGSGRVRLAGGGIFDRPSWSPDGKTVVYQSRSVVGAPGSSLVVRSMDGSDSYIVISGTRGGSNNRDWEAPKWSPDGKRIAFQGLASTGDRYGIFTTTADGGDLRRLTPAAPNESWHPSWSPRGRFIVFASNRSGNFEIYIMRSDGSGVRRLTDHSEVDGAPAWR